MNYKTPLFAITLFACSLYGMEDPAPQYMLMQDEQHGSSSLQSATTTNDTQSTKKCCDCSTAQSRRELCSKADKILGCRHINYCCLACFAGLTCMACWCL